MLGSVFSTKEPLIKSSLLSGIKNLSSRARPSKATKYSWGAAALVVRNKKSVIPSEAEGSDAPLYTALLRHKILRLRSTSVRNNHIIVITGVYFIRFSYRHTRAGGYPVTLVI